MKRISIMVGIVASLIEICQAVNGAARSEGTFNYIRAKEAFINKLLGLDDKLADGGINVALGITQIYQQNVYGGISTSRRAGRFSGSYDLELSADLRKLLGLEKGSIFMHIEGGWPDTEGIDEPSIGSYFGVNADAIGNDAILIKQLYYEGPIFSDNLTLMIGKIDFTGIFDCSAYADDESSQFLNSAFVDNPTIPFPDYSLGIILSYDLTDQWSISFGIADAQAEGRETGFKTAFHNEDYFFYIFEASVTSELDSANGPLRGTYRIGLWYDPQPKANIDYANAGKSYRDDIGFYLSCDQVIIKENTDPRDSQGLGVFFRYGCANSKRNDITNFYSMGIQYQGLIESRDEDVLGIGFAQGFFSDIAKSTYKEDYESVVEIYYNAQITPWLNISPAVQYISNPGGDEDGDDALVLAVRTQISF